MAAHRGRPRSHAADEAIIAAALAVLAERGVRDASVDEIAARAHAGKDTIYRRWPHKGDLVRAALASVNESWLPAPDTGSVAEDLRHYVAGVARLVTDTPFGPIMASSIGDSHHHPDLAAWTRDFWADRRAALDQIISRAVARGELAEGPARILPELLLGSLSYRWLLSGEPFDDAYLAEILGFALG